MHWGSTGQIYKVIKVVIWHENKIEKTFCYWLYNLEGEYSNVIRIIFKKLFIPTFQMVLPIQIIS